MQRLYTLSNVERETYRKERAAERANRLEKRRSKSVEKATGREMFVYAVIGCAAKMGISSSQVDAIVRPMAADFYDSSLSDVPAVVDFIAKFETDSFVKSYGPSDHIDDVYHASFQDTMSLSELAKWWYENGEVDVPLFLAINGGDAARAYRRGDAYVRLKYPQAKPARLFAPIYRGSYEELATKMLECR